MTPFSITKAIETTLLTGIQWGRCDGQLVHIECFIHRAVLIHDYSEFLLHVGEFQPTIRTIPTVNDWLHINYIATHCSRICGTSVALPIRVMRTSHHPLDSVLRGEQETFRLSDYRQL